jgi:hypothetical protein
MRKHRKSKGRPTKTHSSYASIAEAAFIAVIDRSLKELQTKLPADVAPQQMARWVLDFLDRAAQPVRVRNRNGKISSVSCFEKVERNLVAASPDEYQRIVIPFWTGRDFPILQVLLFDLRERAESLGLKARDVEPLLRRRLAIPGRHPDAKPPETLIQMLAKYAPAVKVRLTALSDCIKEHGKSVTTDKDVCKRWDLAAVPVLEKWTVEFGVTTWLKAYEHRAIRPRLHRMISGYREALGVTRRQD